MRKFTFALLLTLLAGEAFAAASSAQMQHVFRRRIEICRAWGGCDEDGTGGGGPSDGSPTISPILTQRIPVNGVAGPIDFTIGDDATPLADLHPSVEIYDHAIVSPAEGVVLSCSGANCTLTLMPVLDAVGVTTVSVTVSDGTLSTTREFKLWVMGDAPVVGEIPSQEVAVDETAGPVSFQVDDLGTPPGDIVLDGSSSDPAVVTDGNISFTNVDGNCTVTVQPEPGAQGSAEITVTALDGDGNIGQRSFWVDVGLPLWVSDIEPQMAFINTPSEIWFAAADANINTLVINGTSGDPSIVPDANISITPCDEYGNCFVTITPADKTGTVQIELEVANSAGEIVTKSFPLQVIGLSPWISQLPDQRMLPEEQLPLTLRMAAYWGISYYDVFSSDDSVINGGDISLGPSGNGRDYSLILNSNTTSGEATITVRLFDYNWDVAWMSFNVRVMGTAPWISAVPYQETAINIPVGPLDFQVDDITTPLSSLVVTAESMDEAVVPNAGILLGGSGGDRTMTITPTLDASDATTTILMTVDNGTETTSKFFDFHILSTIPWVSNPGEMWIARDATFSTTLGVGDDLTPPGELILTVTSSDESVIPASGIGIEVNDTERTLSLTPLAVGTTTISMTISDGVKNSTETFDVHVIHVAIDVADVSAKPLCNREDAGNEIIPIPFTVSDDNGPNPGFSCDTDPWGDDPESCRPNGAKMRLVKKSESYEGMNGEGLGEGRFDQWSYETNSELPLAFEPVSSTGQRYVPCNAGVVEYELFYDNGYLEVSDTFTVTIEGQGEVEENDICNIEFEDVTDFASGDPRGYNQDPLLVQSNIVQLSGFTGPRAMTLTTQEAEGLIEGGAYWDEGPWDNLVNPWNTHYFWDEPPHDAAYAKEGETFTVNPGDFLTLSMRLITRGKTYTATLSDNTGCSSSWHVTTKPSDPATVDDRPPYVNCPQDSCEPRIILSTNESFTHVCSVADDRTPLSGLTIKFQEVNTDGSLTASQQSVDCAYAKCTVSGKANNRPGYGYVDLVVTDAAGNSASDRICVNVPTTPGPDGKGYDPTKLKGKAYIYGFSNSLFYMGEWNNSSWYYYDSGPNINKIFKQWTAYTMPSTVKGPKFRLISKDLEPYMVNDIDPEITVTTLGGDSIGAGAPTVAMTAKPGFYQITLPMADPRVSGAMPTGKQEYRLNIEDPTGRLEIINPNNSAPFFLTPGSLANMGYLWNEGLIWCEEADRLSDVSQYAEWRKDGVSQGGGDDAWLHNHGFRWDWQSGEPEVVPTHPSGIASDPMCMEVKAYNGSVSGMPSNVNYEFKRIHFTRLLMPPNDPEPSIECTVTNTSTGQTFPIEATLQSIPEVSHCTDDCDYFGYKHACLSDCEPGYPASCRQDCPTTDPVDPGDEAQRPYVLLRQYVPWCLRDCVPQLLYYMGEVPGTLLAGMEDKIQPLDMNKVINVSCPKVIASYRRGSVMEAGEQSSILMLETEVYPHSPQPVGFDINTFSDQPYGAGGKVFPNPQPTGSMPVSRALVR